MSQDKKAFITGANGQTGSYLVEELLQDGYKVFGLRRRSSCDNLWRLANVIDHPNLTLLYGDVLDRPSLDRYIRDIKPDEIYHLAAQSHVWVSFQIPDYTTQCIVDGTRNVLEAFRLYAPHARFVEASSSEQFGTNINDEGFQDESTPFFPVSPYACAKTAAHNLVRYYRDIYHLFAACSINFNHESPRRGEQFVTRKITKYLGSVSRLETTKKLKLGNLHAMRDWGFAGDYAHAMKLIANYSTPLDFVIATGESYSIEDFLRECSRYTKSDVCRLIEFDENLLRPNEVPLLRGDAKLARIFLKWEPMINFTMLVKMMIEADAKKT